MCTYIVWKYRLIWLKMKEVIQISNRIFYMRHSVQCCDPHAAACHSSKNIFAKTLFYDQNVSTSLSWFYYNYKSYQDISLKFGMHKQNGTISPSVSTVFFCILQIGNFAFVQRKIVYFLKWIFIKIQSNKFWNKNPSFANPRQPNLRPCYRVPAPINACDFA